ncbi:RNA polymerase I enhancer binding protein [Apophysomyces sp. BC1034]|nr:RNA polymerase I enhancer binding protein [Apophysomyces sp. BC1034]
MTKHHRNEPEKKKKTKKDKKEVRKDEKRKDKPKERKEKKNNATKKRKQRPVDSATEASNSGRESKRQKARSEDTASRVDNNATKAKSPETTKTPKAVKAPIVPSTESVRISNIPVIRTYDSDSSSSDDESATTTPATASTVPASKKNPTAASTTLAIRTYDSDSSSSSSSDDEELPASTKKTTATKTASASTKKATAMKTAPVFRKTATPVISAYDSDSSSSDDEEVLASTKKTTVTKTAAASTKKATAVKTAPVISTYDSDSSSNSSSSSDDEEVRVSKKKPTATKNASAVRTYDSNSSSSSSSSDDKETPAPKDKSRKRQVDSDEEKSHIQVHRLNRFLHREYSTDVDAKKRFKRRLVDHNKKIDPDFFISDSESDSDSDASYNGEPELEWHRKIENHAIIRKKTEENGWPIQTGPWNQNDLLRLEKRIKKLARRQDMSLEMFREKILEDKPGKHLEFWWKVARAFPDRALYPIVRHAVKAYNSYNYIGRWTKEDDKKLMNLVELHGTNFQEVAEHIDRHPAACQARHAVLKRKNDLAGQRWTNEEVDKLIATVEEYKAQYGPDISYEYIAQKGSAISTVYKKDPTLALAKKSIDLKTQLQLLERIKKGGWEDECQIRFSALQDDEFYLSGPRCRSQYYVLRNTLPGFEKMKLKGKNKVMAQCPK